MRLSSSKTAAVNAVIYVVEALCLSCSHKVCLFSSGPGAHQTGLFNNVVGPSSATGCVSARLQMGHGPLRTWSHSSASSAAIIEHVRDGSVVRALLLPDYYLVTVMLSGIKVKALSAEF